MATTTNLSTLKINKLTQSQYDRELAAGNIDANAMYLTPAEDYMNKIDPVGTGSFSMNRRSNTTVGDYSHAEGNLSAASGNGSHAEGLETTSSGVASHAEGYLTKATGHYSHAEGSATNAIGDYSHASGFASEANGYAAHASGYCTKARGYQYVVGKYNRETESPTSLQDMTSLNTGIFIVGIGTSETSRNNGFRINPAGNVYGVGTFGTSGADYAEYFEWVDGNPNSEDRRGRFVTLDGNKIRFATNEDDYILGVVSAEPTVVGDVQSEIWHNMYLKDVYGSKIIETVEVEETIDEYGKVVPSHVERRWKLNPDYNPETEYISREQRPEWDAIGIVGKLVVVDDGTCQVNGYCYPSVDGIATVSQEKTAYRVIERLDDKHVKIFIK